MFCLVFAPTVILLQIYKISSHGDKLRPLMENIDKIEEPIYLHVEKDGNGLVVINRGNQIRNYNVWDFKFSEMSSLLSHYNTASH